MGSSVVSFIHHLKLADEYAKDFVRSAPGTRGAVIFDNYSKRIAWIFRDVITYPHFGDEVREGMRNEIASDAFSYDSLTEKIALMNPEQREMLEGLLTDILKGKTVEINIL
jgi:Fe-S cluster biosynthesis and repair protein YggX